MQCFESVYVNKPWGGSRIVEYFKRNVRGINRSAIGESWELAELPAYHSRAVSGSFVGKNLGILWREGRFGGSAQGVFPFLLKWIDTTDYLSVQVHPDEAYCTQEGHGTPKSEAWYIADASPEACLYLGQRSGLTEALLRDAVATETLTEWMYKIRPKIGEMYNVPAGTMHAIGPGLLILEVQQPSTTTFRICDWQRTGLDGRPRTLHLDEAGACLRYESSDFPIPELNQIIGPSFSMETAPERSLQRTDILRVLVAGPTPCLLASECGQIRLDAGDVLVAEPADGPLALVEGSCLLVSEASVPERASGH